MTGNIILPEMMGECLCVRNLLELLIVRVNKLSRNFSTHTSGLQRKSLDHY